jgi:hypothetical protein
MLRRGAAHGLGVDYYHAEDQCLEILHRPETDTPQSRTASVASGSWPSQGISATSSMTTSEINGTTSKTTTAASRS